MLQMCINKPTNLLHDDYIKHMHRIVNCKQLEWKLYKHIAHLKL